VNHVRRPEFPERFPVHVTWHAVAGVGNLRDKKRWNEIKKAFFLGHEKFGMRMVEFTVQSNHVHFVVEAAGKRSLTRGMQGLAIRIAKAINRASGRHGKVFRDRYDARILRTVAQVRNAVNYVRRNLQHHNYCSFPSRERGCSSTPLPRFATTFVPRKRPQAVPRAVPHGALRRHSSDQR
jgi:REP-associated tyrosine transposase